MREDFYGQDWHNLAEEQEFSVTLFDQRGLIGEVLSALEEGVIIISRDLRILLANAEAVKLFNLPQNYQNHPVQHYLPDSQLNPYFSLMQGTLFENGEILMELAKGTKFKSLRVRMKRLKVAPWDFFMLSFTDTTHVKELERMKHDFTASISHEFRTPLTIIKGQLVNILKGRLGPVDERKTQALSSSIQNIERLHRMVRKILDLSRLESGRTNINRRTLFPLGILSQVIADMEPIARSKGIEIHSPSASEVGLINADCDLMEQMLINLIDNALRYARQHIWIDAQVDIMEMGMGADRGMRSVLHYTLVDDGPGIPDDRIDNLFEKFVQVGREHEQEYSGTGLGLSIVKEIVHLHHGRIWVENDVSHGGAKFHLVLPLFDEFFEIKSLITEVIHDVNEGQRLLGLIGIIFAEQSSTHADHERLQLFEDVAELIQENFLEPHEEASVWIRERAIVVTCDRDQPKTILLAERLQEYLKGTATTPQFYRDFKLSVVFYPKDGQTAEKLLRACVVQFRPLSELAEELSDNILLSAKTNRG